MLLTALLPLLPFFLAATTSAQEVDNGDVPDQCRDVCASTVAVAARCDDQFSDDDAGEVNCICTSANAASEIPNCEACINQAENDGDDDDSGNDILDLVQSCNFVRQSTFTMAGMSATATGTGTSPTATSTSNNDDDDDCDPDDDGDDDCTSSVSSATGSVATATAMTSNTASMVTVTQTQTSASAQATQTSVNGGDTDDDGEDGDDSAENSGSTTNDGDGSNAATGMGVPALAVGGAIMLAAAALL